MRPLGPPPHTLTGGAPNASGRVEPPLRRAPSAGRVVEPVLSAAPRAVVAQPATWPPTLAPQSLTPQSHSRQTQAHVEAHPAAQPAAAHPAPQYAAPVLHYEQAAPAPIRPGSTATPAQPGSDPVASPRFAAMPQPQMPAPHAAPIEPSDMVEEPRWAPDWSPDAPFDWQDQIVASEPGPQDDTPDDLLSDLVLHPSALDPAKAILNDPAAGFIAPGRMAGDFHSAPPPIQAALPTPARRTWFRRSARHDPAPSRVAYRLNRLWLTPLVRHSVRTGLPVFFLALGIGIWLADDARQTRAVQMVHDLRLGFEMRPEFRVHTLSVYSETPEVAAAIADRLDLALPASSFHLDLDVLRQRAETLDAVERAELRLRSGGVLELIAQERVPAIIWRNHAGLELLDAQGHRIARIAQRAARADLPLIAGEGASRAVAEARLLLAAAAPLRGRVRGLVRIGERRWDLVLDNDQRIMLPTEGALAALERVLALDAAQELLARDVTVIDMRNPTRPTIRLAEPALAELNRLRRLETGG